MSKCRTFYHIFGDLSEVFFTFKETTVFNEMLYCIITSYCIESIRVFIEYSPKPAEPCL